VSTIRSRRGVATVRNYSPSPTTVHTDPQRSNVGSASNKSGWTTEICCSVAWNLEVRLADLVSTAILSLEDCAVLAFPTLTRGSPGRTAVLRCDNGPELACAAMADWARDRLGLAFIPDNRGATAISKRSTAGSATNASTSPSSGH
jgi:hypothetical protein